MIDNKKPSVAILFTSAAKVEGTKPFRTRNISRVWTIFSRKAKEYGLNVFLAYHREYKDGKLLKCWYKENNKWKIVKKQPIDVVYSRFAGSIYKDNKVNKQALKFKLDMAKDVTMINHPLLDDFCWDKRVVSETFPQHTPKTFVVNTLHGLKIVLSKIKSKKIILKPRYGTLGRDVLVVNRDNLPKEIEKNTLVQEFIDTSNGIKGITDGIHDLRMIMINGKIDHVHVRTPKEGLLRANVALGGEKRFVDKKLVPKKAKIVAKKVDKLFRGLYPRVYSVDFLFDKKGKPYVVECNSQPMIDKYAFGKYADPSFYDRLLETIKISVPVKVVESY